MDVFTMVVLIVAISAATSVASNYVKARGSQSSARDDAPDLQPRIDALEQRVRQLEAVVTDGDYDLKRRLEVLERP